MQERILLVGEDLNLLKTRALLLAEWESIIALGSEAASVLRAQPLSAVIIGQTIPAPLALDLIAQSRALRPSPAVLLIRFPDDRAEYGVETFTTDHPNGPGWLKERMITLFAARAASIQNTPHPSLQPFL